jgi:ABC-2 type transport system permease protein
VAFARVGWGRSVGDKTTTIGLLLLYWLILMIFWGLWRATSVAELVEVHTTPADLFWYLATTECIALAVGNPYRVVEASIGNGDIAAALLRPIPFAHAMLAEWAGQTLHRVVVLAAGGLVAGLLITGNLPIDIATLPILLLSMAIGCVCVLLCNLQVGYAAAWMGSSTPIFWIWQKLLFVLGGLMIPLTLYPPTLRLVAKYSPFASMLYAPGSMMLDSSWSSMIASISLQCAWLVALSVVTWMVDSATTKRFLLQGI